MIYNMHKSPKASYKPASTFNPTTTGQPRDRKEERLPVTDEEAWAMLRKTMVG